MRLGTVAGEIGSQKTKHLCLFLFFFLNKESEFSTSRYANSILFALEELA